MTEETKETKKTKKTEKQKKEKMEKTKKKKSALRRFIGSIFTAFFLGILVLVIINAYQWHNKGYNTMMFNLNGQYQTEVTSLITQNSTVAAYTIAIFQLINSKFTNLVSSSKEKIASLKSLQHFRFLQNKTKKTKKTNRQRNFITGMLNSACGYLKQIGCMLWASFILLSFKFVSIFAAILIYLFASLLGALDGLVTRYIRTAEGGRESTFVFHKITGVIIQLPCWLIIIYLISPILINPTLVIVLLALSFFTAFNIATANLKKFL